MSNDPIQTDAALIVLAAGYSRRMGDQKLLLPWRGGAPIIRHVVTAVLAAASRIERASVALVCNPDFPSVSKAVSEFDPNIVWNMNAYKGLSSSLRAGIEWARKVQASRAVIVLGDQPDVDPQVIEQVARGVGHSGVLIAQARYRGVPGHPVGFSDRLFSALEAASGDEGGRSVVRDHAVERRFIDVDDDALRDVDTPSDYERMFRCNP